MELSNKLKNRDLYLQKLISFRDTEPVKVITGIRRCGKSSLLKLMADYLRSQGIENDQIIEINFESMKYINMDANGLYDYVTGKVLSNKKMYLFFDELQKVHRWQDAINSFRVDFSCDIYITGSNAYLLSSEFSTYLAGRYIEIKMYPLSFKEFLSFHGYHIKERKNLLSNQTVKQVFDEKENIYDNDELFLVYMNYGGMPGIADIGLEQERVLTFLDGIYSTIVVRDILEHQRQNDEPKVTNPDLLRKIIMFLADNIGNNTSITSIGNVLVKEGLIDEGPKKKKPAVKTIQSYVQALLESYIFYEIKRFDIKGKEYLKTLGKYYITDTGLRNYILGFRDMDTGRIIENIVYFEFLRRGYDVAIGKIANKEIDFIVQKARDKKYVQVTDNMLSEDTRERELSPLRMVHDNYEKIVIAMHADFNQDVDGIKIIKLTEFLLEN